MSARRRGRVGALAITLGVALVAFVLVGPPNLLHAITGPATPRVAQASDGRLSVYAEPDSSGPVLQVISGARHSLDMTMYQLRDDAVEHALAGAAGRGVLVRVVLDRNLERVRNQAAYGYLAAHGVHVGLGSGPLRCDASEDGDRGPSGVGGADRESGEQRLCEHP